jgi:L-arabinokinase
MLDFEPVAALLERVRSELSDDFTAGRPIRVSRAPGRLDVMGGIADYTGSLVCEMPLDHAVAVALQARDDRGVRVQSLNLRDAGISSVFETTLDDLISADALRHTVRSDRGGRWAGYLVGCLCLLHQHRLLNLADPRLRGVNLALLSTVPAGAGLSSSAAVEVAAMMNLASHYRVIQHDRGDALDPMRLAEMCQQVENQIVGAPCGIMDQVASLLGENHSVMRMVCQPHEVQPPLPLPHGIRVVGINSNVKHSVGDGQYGKTRCAAFMGHRIILAEMQRRGLTDGQAPGYDPMRGYLANLDPYDYRRLFRQAIPEEIMGRLFLSHYGGTIDRATRVDAEGMYQVRLATEHHVFEAARVRSFAAALEDAASIADHSAAQLSERKGLLERAGKLMYESHQSYGCNALLGAAECDVLVELARGYGEQGIYGAKITGGGSGGTVAILCDDGQTTDDALAEIMTQYKKATGINPEIFGGSSPGAWQLGTVLA